jgi:hypothetical protein
MGKSVGTGIQYTPGCVAGYHLGQWTANRRQLADSCKFMATKSTSWRSAQSRGVDAERASNNKLKGNPG